MRELQNFNRSHMMWAGIPVIIFLFCLFIIQLTDLNSTLFYQFNSISMYTGTWIWANITVLGDAMFCAVFFLVFIRKRPDLIWTLLVCALVTLLIVHTLKPHLNIDRPARVLDRETFTIIGRVLKRKAFPSGHTATIFMSMGVLVVGFQKFGLRLLLLLIATIVGLSRIVVGAHWPMDVCGGAAAGLIGVLVGTWIACQFPLGRYRLTQYILGGLLLIAAFVLLINYNTHYPDAIWFQRFFAVFVIVMGGREYWLCFGGLGKRESGRG